MDLIRSGSAGKPPIMDIDDGATAWLYKTARRSMWRVCSWYDLDDLVQDGYLHFCRVSQRYQCARSPAHIMSLFKVTFTNHIHDLSKRRTQQLPELCLCDLISTDDDEADFWERHLGFDHEFATCFTAITHASPPVQQLLQNIASDRGVRALRSYGRLFSDGTRETINDKLCRIARCDRQYDLVGALKEVLA